MILALDLVISAKGRPNTKAHHRWNEGNRAADIKCSNCGIIYSDYLNRINKAKKHYCSRECQLKSRSGINNPNWRGGLAKCKCVECGSDFEIFQASIKNGEGKFCSMKCKVLNQTIYESDRERGREANRKRDARKRAIIKIHGTHSVSEWNELLKKYDSKCAKCETQEKITRDHIIPLSKGGTDLISNIQPLCHSCNCKKHARLL